MNNYFSHDSNARNDDKILALRMKHGWEGYGLYWAIVEKLRDSSDYTCVKDYNLIAFDLRSDAAKIKSIVEDFGLFAFTDDGKCLYSESLMRRMDEKDRVSELRRMAASKRYKKDLGQKRSNSDANAGQVQSKSTANAEQNDAKESKVKERKEIKNNPPIIPRRGDGDSENTFSDNPRKREKKTSGKRKELDTSFVEPSFQPIVADWLAYKSERGQTYRQRGFGMFYKNLREYSAGNPQAARKIVERSMANNWSGIFALGDNRQPGNKHPATDYHQDGKPYEQF